MQYSIMLSKWWMTDSCKQAEARAAQRKREQIEKMRASIKARKDQLARDVEEWEIKNGG